MMLDYRLVIPARSSIGRILNSQAVIDYDRIVGGTPIASGLHRKASDSGLLDLHFSNSRAGRNDKFRDLMFLFLKMFFLNLMAVTLRALHKLT